MAKGSHDTLSRVASCADYDSDEGEEVNGTRKQANIAAKRSGGLAKVDLSAMSSDQLQHPVIPDLQSDSGYSSRTQATAASADSGLSAKVAAAAAATVASAGSEVHTVSSTVSSGTRKTATAEKKKKKCTDPNCKHRGRSSKTSSTTSPCKPKARSPPPPRQASPKRRARIDEPEPESRQQRPQRPQRPALRPNPSSSSQAQAQSRTYHPGMTYPMDPRIAAAYNRGHYPIGPASHTMYVNRPMPQRPQMPHYASDMSARKINSRAAYGAQPLVVQQAKSNIVHSARAPPKPAKSVNARHYEDEDEFEEEPESSDEESEEEEEEEEDPRVAMIHAARVKELQELKKRQYELQLHEQRKLQAQQAQQAQQAFQAQQQQAMLAAHKAKEEAARVAMPPPPHPNSAVNTGYSMRRPKNEPSPMITYSDKLGQQINQALAGARPRPTPTGAPKAPSYPVVAPGSRANYATDEAVRHRRRGSVYGSESIAEIEARERALANSFEELERQREELRRQRRESHGATPGYDSQALRAQLQSLSLGTNDRSATAAGMSKNLDAAQSYIERRRDSNSQPQLTAGILRTHGLDRDATSSRSKRSSREGSSTTGHRRRASIIDPEEKYDGDGLKMRVDTKQDYEIEIGNHRIELRPNDEGTIDLYVGGTRENRYHGSKASSVGTSKIGRRMSRRTRIIDDESLSEESEEEDEYDTPRERTSVRGGAARRRAETFSTTYENEPRRRRDSKVPASAERPKRGALRRPVFEDEVRPQRGDPRRPGTPEEDYYRGPPIYGAAPDEYPRFSQGYNRYEPPSLQPPRGYGSKNQNFQGFGG